MSYDYDDTELDIDEEPNLEMSAREADMSDAPPLDTADPVDQQIARVMLSASELAKHTPVADILPQIGGSLGELWSNAEASGNTTALAHIQAAWDNVNLVAQRAQAHGENAAAAIAALGTLKAQRDAAHEAIEDLEGQLEYVDEYVYESFMEGVYSNGGHIFEEPEDEVQEALLHIPGVTKEELPAPELCGQLFECMCSAKHLLEPEGRELIAFIKDFFGRVKARRDAEDEAEYAAMAELFAAAQDGAA